MNGFITQTRVEVLSVFDFPHSYLHPDVKRCWDAQYYFLTSWKIRYHSVVYNNPRNGILNRSSIASIFKKLIPPAAQLSLARSVVFQDGQMEDLRLSPGKYLLDWSLLGQSIMVQDDPANFANLCWIFFQHLQQTGS